MELLVGEVLKEYDKSRITSSSEELKPEIVDNEDCTLNKSKNINEYACLFFSFDIVNSTLFKNLERKNWASILLDLLDLVREECEKEELSANFWKMIGDEIIFTKKISNLVLFYEIIDNIHRVLNKLNAIIQTNERFRHEIEHIDKLALKATAWIADVSKDKNCTTNVILNYKIMNNFEQIEYLGPDIDTGFRISKFSAKNRLVISFEIACLLSMNIKKLRDELLPTNKVAQELIKDSIFAKKISIVTFKELKGVWENRPYPIIWYQSNLDTILDTFDYDAFGEGSIAREYRDNIKGNNPNFPDTTIFRKTKKTLKKISTDMKLNFKLENLLRLIDGGLKCGEEKSKQLEMHCVAVCYRIANNKIEILIFKRTEEFNNVLNVWDFGCSKANKEVSLINTVEKDYLNNFGVEIKVCIDNDRSEIVPIPLALFKITEAEKGIIMLAKINNYNTNIEFASKKYEDHKYITEGLNFSKKNNTISDFEDTLKKAFELIKEIEKI